MSTGKHVPRPTEKAPERPQQPPPAHAELEDRPSQRDPKQMGERQPAQVRPDDVHKQVPPPGEMGPPEGPGS